MISQEVNRESDKIEALSLLRVIHQKEAELRDRVEAAQGRVEAQLQAATQQAEQALAQADREARVEAEALYQQGLKEANEKAGTLVNAAREQAAALRNLVQAHYDEAVCRLVELILPDLAKGR